MSIEWLTPIYDRTAEDVAYAKRVQSTNVLDLKGAWNVSDLNRLENNCLYLRNLLNAEGIYPVTDIKTSDYWTVDRIPEWITDINRIRNNIIAIIISFVSDRGYQDINLHQYVSWQDANILEADLQELLNLTQNMVAEYLPADTFFAGEEW